MRFGERHWSLTKSRTTLSQIRNGPRKQGPKELAVEGPGGAPHQYSRTADNQYTCRLVAELCMQGDTVRDFKLQASSQSVREVVLLGYGRHSRRHSGSELGRLLHRSGTANNGLLCAYGTGGWRLPAELDIIPLAPSFGGSLSSVSSRSTAYE